MSSPTAPTTGPSIGHVHLRVSNLARSVDFYTQVIGLEVQALYGDQAAFLSSNGYHHHIGLNTWDSLGATPPPRGHTGLYHTAFLYPDRKSLAQAVLRVRDNNVSLTGMADHSVSQAIYLDDPDGNGVELYWDRAPNEWPRDADGNLAMTNSRLDLDELLALVD